jgi:hypothetical protein
MINKKLFALYICMIISFIICVIFSILHTKEINNYNKNRKDDTEKCCALSFGCNKSADNYLIVLFVFVTITIVLFFIIFFLITIYLKNKGYIQFKIIKRRK